MENDNDRRNRSGPAQPPRDGCQVLRLLTIMRSSSRRSPRRRNGREPRISQEGARDWRRMKAWS
jgi:hypothetical protein